MHSQSDIVAPRQLHFVILQKLPIMYKNSLNISPVARILPRERKKLVRDDDPRPRHPHLPDHPSCIIEPRDGFAYN